MADDRKTAAIKGWQVRHARQRMLKDAQDFAAGQTGTRLAQDYAGPAVRQNNYVTLEAAEQVYQQNEEPEARKDRMAKLKAWWRWFYHGE